MNFYIQWHEFCPVGEGKLLKDSKQGKKVKNEAKQACTLKKKKRIQQMVVKFSICKGRKKKKKNHGPFFTVAKINSKGIIDLYVKLLEVSRRESLCDFGLGKEFLDTTQRSTIHKRKK